VLASGGLDIAAQPPEQVASFASMLRDAFVPINVAAFAKGGESSDSSNNTSLLSGASLRVLNVDPPVLCVDGFLPPEACDALREAAEASGRMEQSRVGGADTPSGGRIGSGGGDGPGIVAPPGAPAAIRTSTTLAIARDALAASPSLDAALTAVLERAEALFGGGKEPLRLRRGLFSRPQPPAPGQQAALVAELPQVARYTPGQHFLAHEDAFPPSAALQRGFQRRATLLVYLNDVQEGGKTRFEHLGPLEVAPKKGRAAVFFPAFRGGRPDARTLHTATDAAEGHEKWVFQLWLTSAVGSSGGGAGGGGGAGVVARGGGGGGGAGRKGGGKTKRR
jgi:prolyl 4-hydroxylase